MIFIKKNSRIKITVAKGVNGKNSDLIELRTEVYRKAGKHLSDDLMTDEFDDDAYHVGLWYNNQPIASARIIDLPDTAEWEHDRYVNWPTNWPDRHDTAEISRFVIHPSYRSWSNIRLLCHGIASAMFMTNKNYFIACCTADMEVFYKRFFGATMTGIHFIHENLGPKKHQMFVCDFKQGMVGKSIKYADWLSLWPIVTLRGIRTRMLPKEGTDKIGIVLVVSTLVGCVLSPIATIFVDQSRRRRIANNRHSARL